MTDPHTPTRPAVAHQDGPADHPDVTAWVAAYATGTRRRGLFIAGPDAAHHGRRAACLAAVAVGRPLTIDTITHDQLTANPVDRHTTVELLVLDHLDDGHLDTRGALVDLLDARYEAGLSTIITSALRPAAVGYVHGDRVALTVFGTCDVADVATVGERFQPSPTPIRRAA